MPRKWTLRNPHVLPMVITMRRDGAVCASFPALDCSATVWDADPWKARDQAILCCAKVMVRKIEEGMIHGTCIERPAKATGPDR